MYYKFDCLLINRSCVNRNGNTNKKPTGKYVPLNRTYIIK